jgi:hypothetical protein
LNILHSLPFQFRHIRCGGFDTWIFLSHWWGWVLIRRGGGFFKLQPTSAMRLDQNGHLDNSSALQQRSYIDQLYIRAVLDRTISELKE